MGLAPQCSYNSTYASMTWAGAPYSYSDDPTNPYQYCLIEHSCDGVYVLSKAGDLDSMTWSLTQITDDSGRIESIYLNGEGLPMAVDFNQVYNGQGALVSYCETDYDYTLLNTNDVYHGMDFNEDTQPWLTQLRTTWYHYSPSKQGMWGNVVSQNAYTYDNDGQRLTNTISVQSLDSNGDGVWQTDNGNNDNPVRNSNMQLPVWSTSRTETYTYDDLNRLSTVNYGDGEQQSYQFDAMGNRLQKWDTITGTTSYSYDAANMLLTAGGNSYTNDTDGNTLTGGGRTNTWDSLNRLTQCIDGGNTSQYDYGFDNLRHQQAVTSGGATTSTDYGLDGDNAIKEWIASGGTLTQAATYLTGPRGIEYKRFDQNGLVDWYIYDGLGSVVAEINPSGTVQASQTYDVYGNVRYGAGTSQTRHHFVGKLGHISDQETGLIYMRARYYDPTLGRFLSEDPEQDNDNWYVYCDSNPVNAVDPTGLVAGGELDYNRRGAMIGFGALASLMIVIAHYLVTADFAVQGLFFALPKGRTKRYSRQKENSDFDWIAKKHGLSRDEERMLHDLISGENYTREEVDDLAEQLVKQRNNGENPEEDSGGGGSSS